MQHRPAWLLIVLFAAPVCMHAQWLNHRDPNAPRLRDGKPNLSAPAPRRNGKPDLSGLWEVESSSRKEVAPLEFPDGENGLGEDIPSKYFLNFFSDFPFLQEPFQPAAAAMFRERMQGGKGPPSLCPPPSLPASDLVPSPFKIIQMPSLMVMLYEGNSIFFRQIFTDGRSLPADPQPTWLGYSVGKWEGDWLVVDTAGFNDRGGLDAMGHFYSESMRLTERFHRLDFGHLEMEITVNDPKTYTKPVTIKVRHRLIPDSDVIEAFCESETDLSHMRGFGK